MNKKGQGMLPILMGATIFVVLLITIIFALTLGSKASDNLYLQQITNSTFNATTSINMITGSAVTLNGQLLEQSTLSATNTSGGEGFSNFTTVRSPPSVTFTAPNVYNNTNITLTYRYVNTTVPLSAAASNNATVSLGTTSANVPNLALAGIFLAIISIIGGALVLFKGSA